MRKVRMTNKLVDWCMPTALSKFVVVYSGGPKHEIKYILSLVRGVKNFNSALYYITLLCYLLHLIYLQRYSLYCQRHYENFINFTKSMSYI